MRPNWHFSAIDILAWLIDFFIVLTNKYIYDNSQNKDWMFCALDIKLF